MEATTTTPVPAGRILSSERIKFTFVLIYSKWIKLTDLGVFDGLSGDQGDTGIQSESLFQTSLQESESSEVVES